jgi:23S rRNA pseudouridine955/2504/2580 synthase
MPYITKIFILGPNDVDRRLDRILRVLLHEVPLSGIYRIFRDGNVRVSGKKVEGSYRTKTGDSVEIRLPAEDLLMPETARNTEPLQKNINDEARSFARMIVLETPDLAVINKPRGMLTHGQGGVDEAAAAYYREQAAASIAFIPAPLHRLDRNTSGALAVSASLAGAVAFSAALRTGLIEKTYLALLGGELRNEETWIDTVSRDSSEGVTSIQEAGKHAEACARPLLYRKGYTLVSIRLGTGRTHQIRVQAASRGHALAGDLKYGGGRLSGGYLLHCASLGLPPGVCSPDRLTVVAQLSTEALRRLKELFGADLFQCLPPEMTFSPAGSGI